MLGYRNVDKFKLQKINAEYSRAFRLMPQ